MDLTIVPSFTEVDIDGNERTAVRLAVFQRPVDLHTTVNGFMNGVEKVLD